MVQVVWKSKASSKVSVLVWLAINGKWLTLRKLQKSSLKPSNKCCICKHEEESNTHICIAALLQQNNETSLITMAL